MDMRGDLFIGTAAWAIPREQRSEFPGEGSVLERYARRLKAVEINTSFYRPHQQKTYERWAASVPPHFRFSVKLYRGFTHEGSLTGTKKQLKDWLQNPLGLGAKLGVLLIQTPGKLEFAKPPATRFFNNLREVYSGSVVLEARSESWMTKTATALLKDVEVSRVIADPARFNFDPLFSLNTVAYFRLHGSPQIYKSSYTPQSLLDWRRQISAAQKKCPKVWCIFDNTTLGQALPNALSLSQL